MIRLVDDQLLSGILRGADSPDLDSEVFTTGYWYVRLCQAVLAAADRTGVLSGPFTALPQDQRERAAQSLIELPESIGILSLRALGPTIGQLRKRHDLNILGMEVLAAAVQLNAEVHLSAASPRLAAALEQERRRVVLHR